MIANVASTRDAIPENPPPSRAAYLLILGPLVSIAFGRWGSYIGIPGSPIFLADILVLLGVIGFALSRDSSSRGSERGKGPSASLQCISAAAGVCILVGVAGAQRLDLLTFRDAAPFVYLALIPAFAHAASSLGSVRLLRMLLVATSLHTAWFLPAMLGLLGPVETPIAGVPLFVTRSDFDGLICGLAIVLAASYRGLSTPVRVLLGSAAAAAGLISGSRAGLIAAVVLIFGAMLLMRPWRDATRGQTRVGIVAVGVAALVGLLTLMGPQAPAWAQGLQKLIPSDSATYTTGQNTWDARLIAWDKIINYVSAGNAQGNAFTGLGFGSQPVLESGAVAQLSGDTAVRAAHNFFVTWFAFTGYVGVAMVAVIMLIVAVRGCRRYFGSDDRCGVIAYCAAIGTAAAGLAGVIMESPFGYCTFAMMAGIALRETNSHLVHPPEGTRVATAMSQTVSERGRG